MQMPYLQIPSEMEKLRLQIERPTQRTEQGREAIQEIAKQNATPPPVPINGCFLLGCFRVETTYEKGSIDIYVQR